MHLPGAWMAAPKFRLPAKFPWLSHKFKPHLKRHRELSGHRGRGACGSASIGRSKARLVGTIFSGLAELALWPPAGTGCRATPSFQAAQMVSLRFPDVPEQLPVPDERVPTGILGGDKLALLSPIAPETAVQPEAARSLPPEQEAVPLPPVARHVASRPKPAPVHKPANRPGFVLNDAQSATSTRTNCNCARIRSICGPQSRRPCAASPTLRPTAKCGGMAPKNACGTRERRSEQPRG